MGRGIYSKGGDNYEKKDYEILKDDDYSQNKKTALFYGGICYRFYLVEKEYNASLAFGRTSAGIGWCFFGGCVTLSTHILCSHQIIFWDKMSGRILSYLICL